jgi:[methyl-Co(III) methanol-specific corrinoid protein]:coenzyme M methyltransferase
MATVYEMTPKRRFLAGILGGRVDRTPVGSVTSVANVEQMEMTGAFFPDVHRDGPKMARLAAGAHTILGYDALMPCFSVSAEAAALGCEMDWGDRENMPTAIRPLWSDPEQVAIPPDFLDRAPTRTVLDALRILRAEYGSRVAVIGKVMGPWTLAYHLYGLQSFLIETLTDPDRVRRFLDGLQKITILFGQAQIAAGADVLCVADHATGDLVSARMYRDLLLPYHRRITQQLGCPTVLHICGNTSDRLGHICESGFDCFHFESRVDAQTAVNLVGGRISLMGNVNNPEVLLHGSPAQATVQARYARDAGVQVVGPECAIPLSTPTANLKAIATALHPRGLTGQRGGDGP